MESFNKTDNRLVLTELYEVGNLGPGLRRTQKCDLLIVNYRGLQFSQDEAIIGFVE
jgi:hypothetical protein